MTIQNFIVVDDDSFFCKLSSILLKRTLGEVEVKTFTIPEEALEYVQQEYNSSSKPTILFLDINMPTLNAWEFMEQYETFNEKVKEHIIICILSSSINHLDKDKAEANKYITGFLLKPLLPDTILSIASPVEHEIL